MSLSFNGRTPGSQSGDAGSKPVRDTVLRISPWVVEGEVIELPALPVTSGFESRQDPWRLSLVRPWTRCCISHSGIITSVSQEGKR